MRVKQIERPVVGKKLPLTKAFEDMVLSQLPIHQWEAKQKEIRKKIKI